MDLPLFPVNYALEVTSYWRAGSFGGQNLAVLYGILFGLSLLNRVALLKLSEYVRIIWRPCEKGRFYNARPQNEINNSIYNSIRKNNTFGKNLTKKVQGL